jgi:hypothetical protein
MHSYIDNGSGAVVFVPSPEQQQINELKERVAQLEQLVYGLSLMVRKD